MKNKAQSISELAILVVAVALAFGVMLFYGRRAVQGNFKMIEDQVNTGTFENTYQDPSGPGIN